MNFGIFLLIFIAVVIVASIWMTSEHKSGNQPAQITKQDTGYRPSSDFATLIDTIKNEGAAYRNEEKREDNGKFVRDWITIVILTITFLALAKTYVAISDQVAEMQKVYGPIKEQATAAAIQATAAKQQADTAQQSLVGLERPYIIVDYVRFCPSDPLSLSVYSWSHSDGTTFIEQAFSRTNYGRVPANINSIRCAIVVNPTIPTAGTIERPEIMSTIEGDYDLSHKIIVPASGSGKDVCGPSITFLDITGGQERVQSNWKMGQLRLGHVWMIGVIDYTSIVFNFSYQTYFCFVYDQIAGFTGIMHAGPVDCNKRT